LIETKTGEPMITLNAGSIKYSMSGSECWNVLAHASGAAFMELQQLEFTVISYLAALSEDLPLIEGSFDVFASKTFGNLLRAMEKHDYLKPLAAKMGFVKERRDFFVHRFLFHRYGGEYTTDEEYELLIQEAAELRDLFSTSNTSFHDFMFDNAPLQMFAGKRDPETGEVHIVESRFSQTPKE